MKKVFCDVCGKETTKEHYKVTINLDQFVVSEIDVCAPHEAEVRKILGIKIDDVDD